MNFKHQSFPVGVRREVEAYHVTSATSVLEALDTNDCGYISAQNVQKYLEQHANMHALSVDDVHTLLDNPRNNEGYSNNDDVKSSSQSNKDTEEDIVEVGQFLDQEGLQQVFSRPAYHNLARLLRRFTQVQQEVTRRQENGQYTRQGEACSPHTVPIESSNLPLVERLRMQEETAESQGIVLEGGQLRGQPSATVAEMSQKGLPPIFDAKVCEQDKPCALGQEALQEWFKELDLNRDGFVTSYDLSTWCTNLGCQGLVQETDFESVAVSPCLTELQRAVTDVATRRNTYHFVSQQ
jgi:Ca2+-binding EF-hand superfamily protein